MAAAPRKTRARKPKPCPACQGEGTVPIPLLVGRGKNRREVGASQAVCLDCLGSGTAPE